MIARLFAGPLTLSFLLAACGEDQTAATDNRQAAQPVASNEAGAAVYSAVGQVTAISGDQVTIAHGPVDGIGWPAMTMTFTAPGDLAEGLTPGTKVNFSFHQDDGAYVLSSLSKGG